MKTPPIHHLLLATAALLLPAFSQAQTVTTGVPGLISYQGRVLNSAGGLVGAGTPVNRTVIFRIWDHPSNTLDANLIYSESQTVTISEGEFSVLIGQGAANTTNTFTYSESGKGPPTVNIANAFNGSTRYLGVTVAAAAAITLTDNEITPRQQVVSSAFALRSKFAETLGTSTSTALTVLDNGNTGVGTTNPAALFTISGSNNSTSTNTPQMIITDPADLNERLLFGLDRTGNGTGFIQSTKVGTGAQNLALNPNGGNVGIGTASPRSILDVAPGTSITDGIRVGKWADTVSRYIGITDLAANFTFPTTGGFSGLEFGGPASAGEGFLAFHTHDSGSASGERMRIDKLGNVGIGTATPSSKLQVNGGNVVMQATGATDSFGYSIHNSAGAERAALGVAGNGGAYSTSAAQGDAILRATNGKLLLQSGSGAAAITINTSNNVGIGTAAPDASLHVVSQGTGSGNNTAAFSAPNIGVHQSHIHYGPTGSWLIRSASTSGAVILQDSGGNVGIGTQSPSTKLTVRTSSNSYGITHTDGTSSLSTFINATGGWLGTTSNHQLCFFTNGSGSQMTLTAGGRVGIGVLSPVCPLDVRGGTDVVLNGNYTSIKSEWYVQAFGYGTMSDQRIKQIVDRSNTASDLDTVMKLQVTDYQMKAQVMKGNPVHKGLIAQEVEKVIPEAVLKSESYVPDIFELAKQVDYDSESKSLTVTMGKPHGLAVGDMVMITSKDTETEQSHYLKVTQSTDEKAFVVGDVAAQIKKAFVYGKQVKDLRSVDYNRVYTTGIGAIQQIKKEKDAEVKVLRDENEVLKTRIKALEASAKEREEADKAIVTKLAALEKLIKDNAKAAAQPVSLKRSAGGAE